MLFARLSYRCFTLYATMQMGLVGFSLLIYIGYVSRQGGCEHPEIRLQSCIGKDMLSTKSFQQRDYDPHAHVRYQRSYLSRANDRYAYQRQRTSLKAPTAPPATTTGTTIMPAVVLPAPRASFRRVCSWCRCDLGPLTHATAHHSYGICEQCQYRYFAHLYKSDRPEDTALEVLRERTVGE
jgi:hypothetical protein